MSYYAEHIKLEVCTPNQGVLLIIGVVLILSYSIKKLTKKQLTKVNFKYITLKSYYNFTILK